MVLTCHSATEHAIQLMLIMCFSSRTSFGGRKVAYDDRRSSIPHLAPRDSLNGSIHFQTLTLQDDAFLRMHRPHQLLCERY
jgi:hypothetical protein